MYTWYCWGTFNIAYIQYYGKFRCNSIKINYLVGLWRPYKYVFLTMCTMGNDEHISIWIWFLEKVNLRKSHVLGGLNTLSEVSLVDAGLDQITAFQLYCRHAKILTTSQK